MEAFHNNSLIKELYLTRLNKHYQADEIVKGQYWENGKGCAVGCTIHSSNHEEYESKLGIPKSIAYLQDTIFEGLSNELAKDFPLQFLSAIKVGADLKNVWNLFVIWQLTNKKYGVLQYTNDKKVIQDVADILVQDMVSSVSAEKWKELRRSVYAAADFAGIPKNTKSKWYIAASKKLIQLLKNAN